jgi:hypothetical protein
MQTSLNALIWSLGGETNRTDPHEHARCRIAIVALLIRAASIDADMSPARCNKLFEGIFRKR